MLAVLGFATIAVFLFAIMTKRLSVLVALILIPAVAGLLAGAGAGLGRMMLEGIGRVAPVGVMIIFAVLYFGLMLDVGLFDPMIRRLLRFVKGEHPALHPGRSAFVELDGKRIGFIGELHPRWLQKYDLPQAPVLFEVDAEALRQRAVPSYAEISKFPGATRDLALVVKQGVAAQEVLDTFHAEIASNPAGKIVQAVVLFDEYRGKGLETDEKSLAFRFGLQDTQSTLQDDAVDAIMAAVARAAQEKVGAKLRA